MIQSSFTVYFLDIYLANDRSIMYETEIRKQIKTNFDYSSVTEKIRNV